ncbi:MAG TPA: hypothetical protein VK915_13060 [Gaiellaceae bacterium]|nr:hypothetical protein [Gaiellaceae bacterium]
MALAERVDDILRGLPRGWERARLDLTLEEPDDADRAGLILAPATPGRSGGTYTLHVHGGTRGLAPTPELVRRVVSRLDEAGIRGRVALAGHEEGAREDVSEPAPRERREPLAATWDATLRRLPPDWSDLYAEIELDSTDYLDRGALLLAPVNPARYGGPATFRFRAARRQGYGVASGMARRAFERLDEEGLTGRVRVLRVLSDSSSTFTQGPVWRVGGRSV